MSKMWLYKSFIACCEAVGITYILHRSKKSKDSYVKAQLLLIPYLFNFMLIQVLEAIIWFDEDNMISITARLNENGTQECSNLNRNITVFLWMVCIPMQPVLLLYALRRMGDKLNKERLMTAEILAFGMMIAHWIRFVDQKVVEAVNTDNPLYNESPRWFVQKFVYRTYDDRSTCSYIGYFGNLFHTLNTSHDWFTPNGMTHYLCFVPALFAKPYKFFPIFILFQGIYAIHLKRSFYLMCEVISVVNCRMGILSILYVIIQPKLFPCKFSEYNYEYDDSTTLVDNILSDIGVITNLDKTIPMFSGQKDKRKPTYNGPDLSKYN